MYYLRMRHTHTHIVFAAYAFNRVAPSTRAHKKRYARAATTVCRLLASFPPTQNIGSLVGKTGSFFFFFLNFLSLSKKKAFIYVRVVNIVSPFYRITNPSRRAAARVPGLIMMRARATNSPRNNVNYYYYLQEALPYRFIRYKTSHFFFLLSLSKY